MINDTFAGEDLIQSKATPWQVIALRLAGSANRQRTIFAFVAVPLQTSALVITTLDRLGISNQKMLELTENLRTQNMGLHILKLGGDYIDAKTPMAEMTFTVMATLVETELKIKCEHLHDSVIKPRTIGSILGGQSRTFTACKMRTVVKLLEAGEPATQSA